ncbi:MAG: type VI secretion system tip protein VgrG [Bacteroidales bacterium]|nr:type VI secretion system tip protein VgrG [Candidatus Physcousia equi]
MSTKIKELTLSISGTPSKNGSIELDGRKYTAHSMMISTALMTPASLTFCLQSSVKESVEDTNLSLAPYLMGRFVELEISYDNIEIAAWRREEDGMSHTKLFEGFITSVDAMRSTGSGTGYCIGVESVDFLMMNSPTCRSFENMTLEEIVRAIIDPYKDEGNLDSFITPRYEDVIPYCVQYNETDYEFLSRLAKRYGEWMLNTGSVFIFGDLSEFKMMSEAPEFTLKYPSKDLVEYGADLRVEHTNFQHLVSSYNSNDTQTKEGQEEAQKELSPMNQAAADASEKIYPKQTLQQLNVGGFADSDSKQKQLDLSTKTLARAVKARMLQTHGKSYVPDLMLGTVVTVNDYVLANRQKGEVISEKTLITSIDHYIGIEDKTYSNRFQGIASECDYPPYGNPNVFPASGSCRAKVTDNEDPKGMGRIRVQFDWQEAQDASMMTPWIRIATPYAGGGKGFNFIPEIGEEVMVDFEGGNAERPYVCGMLFNGVDAPEGEMVPNQNSGNPKKTIRTKNGHTIEFEDTPDGDGQIRIYDKGKDGYVIRLDSKHQSIEIKAKGDIWMEADKDITIRSGNDITIHADNNLQIEAMKEFYCYSGEDFKTEVKRDRITNVSHNDELHVEQNRTIEVKNNQETKVSNKLQEKAASVRIEADQDLKEASTNHSIDAKSSYGVSSNGTVDIKGNMTKIN